MSIRRWPRNATRPGRRGVSSLDYVLLMGVVLPLVAFVYWAAPKIMNLVYQLSTSLIAWPFQ